MPELRTNAQAEKNWFDRNLKWSVPLLVLGGGALLVGVAALILTFVFGLMRSSDAYKDALSRAKANPAVQQAIGTPIEEGLFLAGNINVSGSSGYANLVIPVSGPKGKATIHVVATKAAGKWTFLTLEVAIKATGQRIVLREPSVVEGENIE